MNQSAENLDLKKDRFKIAKRAGALIAGTALAVVLPISAANAEETPQPSATVSAEASPSASPEASESPAPVHEIDDSGLSPSPSPEATPSLPPQHSIDDSNMVIRPTSPELPRTGAGFPVEDAAVLGGALLAAGAAAQVAGQRKQ